MTGVPASGAGTTGLGRRHLSIAAVARTLGVSPRTVRLWAECGEIPAIKAARQWRIEQTNFELWLLGRNSRQ